MASTRFSPTPDARPMIPPTEEDTTFRHRCIQGEVQDENAWLLHGVAGHAGLFSNVTDLLRFATEILSPCLKKFPPPSATNLFNPETVQLFAQRQGPRAVPVHSAGIRHRRTHRQDDTFLSIPLGIWDTAAVPLWLDLDAEVAVVLLTNRTWPDRAGQLIRQVRPAFHDAVREAI